MFQTCDPRDGAQFDLRGIIWTTLVEVHQEMLHTKYQTSAPSSFRKEEFWSFPSLFLCFEIVTPGASYEQSWYKSTRRCFIPNIKALHFLVSEKKNFKIFLLCSYVSNLWHPPLPPGQGQFGPQGHHMNNLGRSPLGDTTYKISKLCTFQFQRRRIIRLSFFVPMFQTCDPRGGASFDLRDIIWTILVEVH